MRKPSPNDDAPFKRQINLPFTSSSPSPVEPEYLSEDKSFFCCNPGTHTRDFRKRMEASKAYSSGRYDQIVVDKGKDPLGIIDRVKIPWQIGEFVVFQIMYAMHYVAKCPSDLLELRLNDEKVQKTITKEKGKSIEKINTEIELQKNSKKRKTEGMKYGGGSHLTCL